MANSEQRKAEFARLNSAVLESKVIPDLKEKVMKGVSIFLQLSIAKVRGFTNPTDGSPKKLIAPTDMFEYDLNLNAGIFALGLVKSKLKDFESMSSWGLPSYYDTQALNELFVVGEAQFKAYLAKGCKVTKDHLKTDKVLKVKISGQELDVTEVAWMFIYSLSFFGVWVNAGHHMASVGQITTLMSLFFSRFKDVWYQDAGVNLKKNVKKEERGKSDCFQKLSNYGFSRMYYHHFRMLNYPREIKGRLRKMTGVGTDFIDFINIKKSGKNPMGELEKIERALKKKLAFWSGTTTVVDILDFLDRNKDNSADLQVFNSTLMSVINLKMPAVEYKIVMPAIYWFYLPEHKIYPDFSAQGAYIAYQWLSMKLSAIDIEYTYKAPPDDISYAVILSIFDLHQADQNILKFMFGLNPRRRGSFVPKLEKPKENEGTAGGVIKLPTLAKWSKMYNGERGGSGDEQASVVQTFAGASQYSGDDFILSKPDSTVLIENLQNKVLILQRLQSELQVLYKLRHEKKCTYGTQFWYTPDSLSLTNKALQELEPKFKFTFKSAKIIPFYTAVPLISEEEVEEPQELPKKRPAKASKSDAKRSNKIAPKEFMDTDG